MYEKSIEKGDGLWFFTADKNENVSHDCSDAVRRHLGKTLKLINPDVYAFLWVYDFPLFDYDAEANTLHAKHHPFTRPKDEDVALFFSNDKSKIKDVKAMLTISFVMGMSLAVVLCESSTINNSLACLNF